MRLLSLEVQNYRNIASASLTPGRELTVICGNNGQGKTNLLEAIWRPPSVHKKTNRSRMTRPVSA